MWLRKILAYTCILILSLSITITIVPAPAALDVTDGLHKIAPDVRSQMEIAKNESQNETISVIIMLEQQHSHRGSNFKDATEHQRHQIIHSMKSLAEDSQEDVLTLLENQKPRGNVEDVKAFWIVNAIAVKATPAVLKELAQRPEVKLVEPDYKVKALEENLPCGVDRIDAELVWNGTEGGTDVVAGRNAGDGINVSILDTGIDYNHSDLAENVKGGHRFLGEIDDYDYMDDNGHGTHCAGIVAAVDNEIGVIGTAPKVNLYGVKVLDIGGEGYESDVIKGIEWSVENNMDIISMSLGSDSGLPALKDVCEKAYNEGLLLVAAAGNAGNPECTGDNVSYPAKYDSVIAVAATNSSDNRASISSTGQGVELAAPGVSIYSTWRNDTYATSSGTSMACPHVTGTAALVWRAYPDYNNTQVRQRLQETAEDLGVPGRDEWYGYGLVDAEKAARDTTPPASVTNLNETAVGETWINWTWTNPTDEDFNYTMVYLNGTWKVNTSNSFYNATGLNASTNYEIATHTADKVGNVNETWVNDRATTLPDTTPSAITIISPENKTYATAQIHLNASADEPIDTWMYNLNGTGNVTFGSQNNTVTANTTITAGEGSNNITVYANDTAGNVGNSSMVYFTVDTTPPADVTNLNETAVGEKWINWTWTNPTDDFNHTMVYLNGSWRTNTSAEFYNATGLNASTNYEIGTHTVDKVGNVNETWVNDTATTLPDTTPPIVLSTSPANDDTNIEITTTISVTFNELMNKTSVKNAFSISPTVDGEINCNENTMIFDFSSNLAYSKAYTVTINASIAKDLAGNFLDGNKNGTADGSPIDDYVWSFTTKASSTEGGDSGTSSGSGSSGGGGGGAGTPVSNVPTDTKGVVRYTVTLTSRDENALLKVPKGTTVLDAQGNPLTSSISILSPPLEGAVAAYDLRPNGVKFEPSLKFSIHYDPAKIPEGTTESELVIKVYENDAWTVLDTTVDMTTHTATTKVSHFTVFALFAEVASAPTPEVMPTPTPTSTPSPIAAPMSIPTLTPTEATPTPTPTPTLPPVPLIPMVAVVIAIVAAVIIVSLAYMVLRGRP